MSLHRACCCGPFCVVETYDPMKVYRSIEVALTGFATLECNGCFGLANPVSWRFTAYTSVNGTYAMDSLVFDVFGTQTVATCIFQDDFTVGGFTRTEYDDEFCGGSVVATISRTAMQFDVIFDSDPTKPRGLIQQVLVRFLDPGDGAGEIPIFDYQRVLDTQDRFPGDPLPNLIAGACQSNRLFISNGTATVTIT